MKKLDMNTVIIFFLNPIVSNHKYNIINKNENN